MGKGWKNPIKTANAAKKGAIFTKLAREISVASKTAGPDPNANPRLRLAIDAARKQQCPTETIERAIKKGAGLLTDAADIEEIMYEGYGPHGVGAIVVVQTDNRNRTVPELRVIFKSHGGNLGEAGSVSWMFEKVALIEATKPGNFDPDEEAIEAGANEVEKTDEGYSFFAATEALDDVRKTLTTRGWNVTTAELFYKAKNLTELTEEQMKDVHNFLNELDDHDDSHRVYASIKH